MRSLPPSLLEKLEVGVSTLAHAWCLTRTDGQVVRMTDHDRDVVLAGAIYHTATGLIGQSSEADLTLAPGRTGLSGALDVDGITEADLKLGRWDDAVVQAFVFDWEQPESLVLLWTGKVSSVHWRGQSFELELVGPEAALAREIGGVFRRTCSADLGDQACGVNLNQADRQASTSIVELVSDQCFSVTPPVVLPRERLKGGIVTLMSGPAKGWTSRLIDVTAKGATWLVHLAEAPAIAPQHGDTCQLTIACDKQFSTCLALFNNGLNFRGCPTMPGDDVAFSGPAPTGNGGGKR